MPKQNFCKMWYTFILTLLLLTPVCGSNLYIRGTGSTLQFGDAGARTILKGACEADQPSVMWIEPQAVKRTGGVSRESTSRPIYATFRLRAQHHAASESRVLSAEGRTHTRHFGSATL